MMARYMLGRITEKVGLTVSFHPKLFEGWNGAGAHTNYSTKNMRAGIGGMKAVTDLVEKLGPKHETHMSLYGLGND